MKQDPADRVFTEANEGNQELARPSFPSLPSVTGQGFPVLLLDGVEP